MSSRWRWTMLAAVVATAVGVALWPRLVFDQGINSEPSAVGVDLIGLRKRAALPACLQENSPDAPHGTVLAGIKLTCLSDGSTVDIARVSAGGPLLINLWAPWCGPCRNELPVLAAYANDPRGASVSVLAVQVHSDMGAGLTLLADLGVRLPAAFAPDDQLQAALQAPQALPVTYLVKTNGTLHRISSPAVFDSTDQVRLVVSRLLAE